MEICHHGNVQCSTVLLPSVTKAPATTSLTEIMHPFSLRVAWTCKYVHVKCYLCITFASLQPRASELHGSKTQGDIARSAWKRYISTPAQVISLHTYTSHDSTLLTSILCCAPCHVCCCYSTFFHSLREAKKWSGLNLIAWARLRADLQDIGLH